MTTKKTPMTQLATRIGQTEYGLKRVDLRIDMLGDSCGKRLRQLEDAVAKPKQAEDGRLYVGVDQVIANMTRRMAMLEDAVTKLTIDKIAKTLEASVTDSIDMPGSTHPPTYRDQVIKLYDSASGSNKVLILDLLRALSK